MYDSKEKRARTKQKFLSQLPFIEASVFFRHQKLATYSQQILNNLKLGFINLVNSLVNSNFYLI